MSPMTIFVIITFIILFVILYRRNNKESVYKFIVRQTRSLYDKYAPYSYKVIREKIKDLGQEYTTKEYTLQIVIFAASAAVISYLYFYNLI